MGKCNIEMTKYCTSHCAPFSSLIKTKLESSSHSPSIWGRIIHTLNNAYWCWITYHKSLCECVSIGGDCVSWEIVAKTVGALLQQGCTHSSPRHMRSPPIEALEYLWLLMPQTPVVWSYIWMPQMLIILSIDLLCLGKICMQNGFQNAKTE